MGINEELMQKLKLVLGIFTDSFGQSLSTITNTDTNLRIDKVEQISEEELKGLFSGEVLKIVVNPVTGIEGEFTFVWTKEFAAKVADMMSAGKGDVPFSEEEHLEPVQEITSQLMGPVTTEINQYTETKVEFDPPIVALVNFDEIIEQLHSQTTALITGSLGDFEFTQLLSIPDSLAEELAGFTIPVEEILSESAGEVLSERVEFEPFPKSATKLEGNADNIELLMDLQLQVSIELGRTKLFIKNILELGQGSVIELNKLSGDPVDIYVNEKKFAEGEVVVVDENFGVRITDVIAPSERVQKLSS